jgi:hypothetical protein
MNPDLRQTIDTAISEFRPIYPLQQKIDKVVQILNDANIQDDDTPLYEVAELVTASPEVAPHLHVIRCANDEQQCDRAYKQTHACVVCKKTRAEVEGWQELFCELCRSGDHSKRETSVYRLGCQNGVCECSVGERWDPRNIPGSSVVVRNGEGEMAEGVSYPNYLLKHAHDQRKCDAMCDYCYDEACKELDEKGTGCPTP